MKNFLRALRHTWPYRRRLFLSIAAALCAAILWGLNFCSVYPVLKLLRTEQSPRQWVEDRISTIQKEIDTLQDEANLLTRAQQAKDEQLAKEPGNRSIEKELRDLAAKQTKVETKLASGRDNLWRHSELRLWINKWCPDSAIRTLAALTAMAIVCLIFKCLFEFVQESLVGSVVNLTLFDMRNRFYRNVIHLDVSQFGEQGTSELMARFTNDMEAVGTGLKMLFGKVVAEPLRALACVIFAMYISWQLTLMFLVLVPIALFFLSRVGRIMKRATRRLLERMSNIYKILHESFRGIRVVKAFTMEPYERRRFCAATKDYYHKAMLVVNIDALADPIIEILGATTVAAALLAGSYLVLTKQTEFLGMQLTDRPLEAEALLQLYIMLAAIADPVRKLSSVFTRLQSGCAAADRVFAYLDRQPAVRTNAQGLRLARLPRKAYAGTVGANYIEFRDLCFSYEPSKPILSHINLTIRAGEKIAVVGKNGSGKTTLLSLLPRMYDPDHGSIYIEGQDLRHVHLRSLRQLVGLVMQEPFLFDDTVFNNIAYGHRAAKREAVEAAAKAAFAHDFIVQMPRGYDTQVGEAGNKLSGGQKQRVALARTMLRDPGILILDEFTSQYDAESEALIHKALGEFMAGRTTLMITHRMHTLEIADRIVVLDAGRLVAVGSHSELLAACPIYQRLHEANTQRLVAEHDASGMTFMALTLMDGHRESIDEEPTDSFRSPRLASFLYLFLLTLLCAFLFFYRLADRDLWSSHEARAGMDAQTILDDGDWLLPHLYDGQAELQKPPLYYWLVALVALLRGGQVDAWAVRLPSALAAAACVAVLVFLGRCCGRLLAGVLAGVVLATTLHFTWLARIGRTDMPLTLCVAVAVIAWRLGRDDCRAHRAPMANPQRWLAVAFLAMTAGVLMKGPLALVLPAGILICQRLLERAVRRRSEPEASATVAPEPVAYASGSDLAPLIWGIPLVLALTLPWFLAANARSSGELFRVFIWHHNVERGFGGSQLRGHPWWFYGAQFFVDFQPWSAVVLAAGFWCWRRGWWWTDAELRFGLTWFLAVALVLSCFRFKRADYLLPAYPGAAWFLGCAAARALAHAARLRRIDWPGGVTVLGLVAAAAMAAGWAWKVERALPEEERSREYRTFAAQVRTEAPTPTSVIFFRTEAHLLAFHVGRPLAVLLEWQRLREQLGRQEQSLVVLPAAWLEAAAQKLPGIRLEELSRHPHLGGPPRERPLVLVRAMRKDQR